MRSLWKMFVLSAVVVVGLTGLSAMIAPKDRRKREVTKLRYHDCGKSDKAVTILKFNAQPMPILIPGYLHLKIHANITRDLPRKLDVRLKLKRKFAHRKWLKLPCLNKQYGSCRYKTLESCILTQHVFGCPVKQSYQEIDQRFYIPYQDDDFLSLLTGEYKAVVRGRHPQTKEELVCLIAHFSLKS